ncbi:hypothetical protein A2617_02620 [Candidatus Daviesbacteria bacterium RIFOXYD1_FULL_41_10]|uniref:Uncharacterized protein n=1 Tax=Candidatus Daviesbacteria bacterium RIFOXYD1_FULL_41_10 TaxID=1797801 RepID=A0A1F5MZA8_9BACT|nr:MAG: hypothetical protein A2617_02620 [Candidatus Daviesbacteria bacterium RIFOXYD1_FULL_41_10]
MVHRLVLIILFLPVLLITMNSQPITAHAQEIKTEKISPQNWGADKQSAFSLNTLPYAGICLLAQIAGCPVTVFDTVTKKTTTELISQGTGGGAVMALANLTTTFYQSPPASSTEYLAHLGEQFGLGEPAFAKGGVGGSGDGIIAPVYNLWMVARSISYIAFILIFIIIGFMIMFRQKISQQAVISAQAALPGLIVSLVIITFSYAISALMVDTAFLGTKLMGYVFSKDQVQIENKLGNPIEMADNSNMFGMFFSAMGNAFGALGEVTSAVVPGGMPILGGVGGIGVILGVLIAAISGPLGWIVGGAAMAPVILTLLIGLILLIALLVQMVKLFFALLNSYIQLLVFTIAGPLMIAFSAIPGKGGGMSFWIRGTLANALVFPAVFATFLFAGLILANTNPADWQVSPPLFAGFSAEILRVILAYGIILGTPAIPGMIREIFKVKGPQAFAQAAMGGAMAGVAVGKAGYGAGTGRFKEEAEAWSKAKASERASGTAAPVTYKPWYRIFGR